MYDFVIYMLQSAACLAAFYLLYKLAMSRETLHRLNRVLLLSCIVLSAVLPLCRITLYRTLPVAVQVGAVDEVPATVLAEEVTVDWTQMWHTVAVVLFLLGATAMALRIVLGVIAVGRKIRSGAISRLDDGSMLTVVDTDIAPFSWFGHIVVSREDIASDAKAILTHERAHIALHHSWDILAVDVVGCVQWFNPALWLLRRELQALHEYEADEAVLRCGVDARQYQMLLIKKAVGKRFYTVANCLNHSKLKNRITMMLQKPSSRYSAAKALLILPLVGLSLGAFARTVYVLPEQPTEITQNSAIDQIEVVEPAKQQLKGRVAKVTKPDGKSTEQTNGKIEDVRIVKYHDKNSNSATDAVYYLDGKKAEAADIKSVDAESIKSMTILKGQQAVDGGYDLDGKGSVIVVSTKEAATDSHAQGSTIVVVKGANSTASVSSTDADAKIIVDGKEVDYAQLDALGTEKIESVRVDKSGAEDTIYVTTKPAAQTQSSTVVINSATSVSPLPDDAKIFIDGKKSNQEQMQALGSEKIESIRVDNSGEKCEIYVTTKSAATTKAAVKNKK